MSFQENGYRILRGVFVDEALGEIRQRVDELIDINQGAAHDPLSDHYLPHRTDNGVLYDMYQRHGFIRPMAENSVILDAVEEMLGENFYLYVNSLLYKPKSRENVVPWHQDFMSRPDESGKILAWMAIDDATRNNGCLKVIPGSHRSGFREWYRVKGATHHDRIRLADEEIDRAIYVELNAGDVLLFSNYLIHSSEENNSDRPRRAYRAVYKQLDDARIPRGSPIMMRANPSLYASLNSSPPQTGLSRRLALRLGRKLISFGRA